MGVESALDELDRFFDTWPGTQSFANAVSETVSRRNYAPEDVEQQLWHVAERSSGRTMRRVLELETGSQSPPADAPRSVAVLAAGRVPGLALEGIAAAIAIGAKALVRPSRDETVLQHVVARLRDGEFPRLAERIEVAPEIPWERADAAIVFGADETIAMVRDRMPEHARQRVAGYGSRQGIAVVMASAASDPEWARLLADDVLTFRQAGCMSPSWLFVVGTRDEAAALQDTFGRALAVARDRHVASLDIAQDVEQRRASDADVLGAIAAGLAPTSAELYAGDARLTIVRASDEHDLVEHVGMLRSLLQTAVIAAGDSDEHERIVETLLARTGITRACAPGQAHLPDPLWPQDGIGRIAPLLGR